MTRTMGTRALVAGLAALALAGCIPEEGPPKAAPPVAAPAKVAPELDGKDSKALLQAVEALKGRLEDRPRDFTIDLALGNLFYDNGRYVEALEYYRDAANLGAAAEKTLLALRDKPAARARDLPAACRPDEPAAAPAHGPKSRPLEALAAAAAAQLPADGPLAVACWRQLVPALAGLHARAGNSWYLAGNPDKAGDEHQAALALDPDQPESLFFRGAHLLEGARGDPARLAGGRAEWEHLLRVAPDHPRAAIVRETLPRIDELFGAHPPPADAPATAAGPSPARGAEPEGPGPLPAGVEQAMQHVPMTPESAAVLDQKLADGDVLLARGDWQAALDAFKAVMPLRPDGRVALGLGVALRELGKPTAERVLLQAARMPGGDPARARFELAIFYEKGSPDQARALYAGLLDDPKAGPLAKARLARLK